MAVSASALWVIDHSDPALAGLYSRADSRSDRPGFLRFTRDQSLSRQIQVVQPALPGMATVWQTVDLTGALVEVGVGQLDQAPTAGTFALSYAGSGTGLTALAYNISAAALQTALNANAAITAAGGVTVALVGSYYTITFNTVGSRPQIMCADASGLTPLSRVIASTAVTGDASTRSVQTLQLVQQPYASSSTWTPVATGTVAATTINAGDSSSPARFRVAFSDPPESGSVRVEHSIPQISAVTATANTGALARFIIDFFPVSDLTAFAGSFIDLFDASNNVVRLWWRKDGTTPAPDTPPGGRLLRVDYVTGDTVALLASKTATALNADADFDGAYQNGPAALICSYATNGLRSPLSLSGAVQLDTRTNMVTPGSSGALTGRYFFLPDRNGTVCCYFTAGLFTSAPTLPTDFLPNRYIAIPLAIDATATAVATAIQTAIDADAEFTATVSGPVVTVTDSYGGARTVKVAPGANTLPVATTRAGSSVSASIPFGSDAQTIASLLGGAFNVTVSSPLNWTLTRTINGTMPDLTVSADSIQWPSKVQGSLVFNGLVLHQAFAATTSDTISALLEVVITPAGGSRQPILQVRCELNRNLLLTIGAGETAPSGAPFVRGIVVNRYDITALTGSTANSLDSIATVGQLLPGTLIAIDTDDAAAIWRLRQLSISSISAAAAAVVTTARAHGFTTGQSVTIGGSNCTPSIDGARVVTVLSSATFSVPVTTSGSGSAGYATPAEDAIGLVRPDDFNASTNAIFWQSVL